MTTQLSDFIVCVCVCVLKYLTRGLKNYHVRFTKYKNYSQNIFISQNFLTFGNYVLYLGICTKTR